MMSDDSKRLLHLLRLFPGMTLRALKSLHGFKPDLVQHCITQGLIKVQEQVVGHRSGCLHVFRFYVNRVSVKDGERTR